MGCVKPEAGFSRIRPTHCLGRVLLISDRELCRAALEKSLGQQGFDVRGAVTHDEACSDDFLAGWDFDVVVLDTRNASVDPSQAVGTLKQKYSSARVVLCSGAMAGAALGKALGAGAFAFILQPFDAAQIACLVRLAIDHVPSNDRGSGVRALHAALP